MACVFIQIAERDESSDKFPLAVAVATIALPVGCVDIVVGCKQRRRERQERSSIAFLLPFTAKVVSC